MADSHLFLQAWLTRYHDHQGVDLNYIYLEKVKWYSLAMHHLIISFQPIFLTNRSIDWQCGNNEHSSQDKE